MTMRQRKVFAVAIVAAAYALGSQLAFSWFGAGGLGASFFPAAGVTMAALILLPRQVWPSILVAVAAFEFTIDLLHGIPPIAGAGYVVANLAQPLLGAVLITRTRPSIDLSRTSDLLTFLVVAVAAAPALGGALGATTFTLLEDGTGWFHFAAQWWVGDGLGVLVVGTAILATSDGLRRAGEYRRHLETVAFAAVGVAASVALFWLEWLPAAPILFLVVIVTGFRVGTWAVALIGAVVAFIAAQATAGDRAFWRSLDLSTSDGVLYLQITLGVVLMSALGIAAEIGERQRTAEDAGAARRLQELADAAPAMLWVTDAENRCTFLSRGWYEYTGVHESVQKDLAWTSTVHPDDRDAAMAEFTGAAARGDPFTFDYRIRRADGVYRRAIDAGRPRRAPDGALEGYVGTVLDVDEHLRVEDALRRSESQLRALFESIDEGYCLCEMIVDGGGHAQDYRFIEVNAVFEEMTGLAGARGRTARELVPDLESDWVYRYAEVGLEGRSMRFEQGSAAMGRVFNVFATPMEPPGRFAVVFTDITERRRGEAAIELAAGRDRFRSDLTDRLRSLGEPDAIYAASAEGLGTQLGAARVFFGNVDADDQQVLIQRSYPAGEHLGARRTLEELVGQGADAVRAGRTVVVADVGAEVPTPYLDLRLPGDARAYMVVGLVEAGRLAGLLGVLHDAPHQWTDEETALVESIAQRTWLAVQRARSERALRESEARFRSLSDAVPDLIWMTDPDDRNEFVNVAYSTFVGAPPDKLKAMAWTRFVHPADIDDYLDAFRGTARNRGHFVREMRMQRADGAYRWMRTMAEPREVDGRYAGYVGATIDMHEVHLKGERDALLADIYVELDREVGARKRVERLPQLVLASDFADHCRVLLFESAGTPALRARAARREADEEVMDRLDEASPITHDMLARASAHLITEVSDDFLVEVSESDADLALRRTLDLRTAMAVPLIARGRHVGLVSVARSGTAVAYSEQDLATLVEVARRAAISFDNAALFDAEVAARQLAERSRARLDQLHRLTAALSAATSAADVGRVATADIVAASEADAGWLVSGTPEDDMLTTLATVGYPAELVESLTSIPADAPMPLAECTRSGQAIFVESEDEVLRAYPDFARVHESIGAVAFIPVDPGGLGLCFAAPRVFTPLDREHLLAMGRLTAQALQRARRFEDQRILASRLQRSLLPADLPALPGISLARSYAPGMAETEVGGDWYDALELPGGRLAVTVGDVVGRGLEAAIVMGQLRSALSGFLIAGFSPGAALTHLNAFAFTVVGASCASAVCFVIDTATGIVTWARAPDTLPCAC